MSAERLQKVLAYAGVGSRRRVEELIREGRITVNGKVAELGQRVDLATDAVKVDDRRILAAERARRYILVNKPSGCISTSSDPEGRLTVVDLVPQRLRTGLKPVGRLDFETEGLMLLTDDGELAHRIAHPSFGCTKTYEVKVRGRPTEAEVDRLRAGIFLEGRRTQPASIVSQVASHGPRDSVKNSWWTVILSEGRTRQIREMFFRIGHQVLRLRRVAIGPLRDPRLARGQWRELEEKEVALLQERFKKRKKKASPERASRPVGRAPKERTLKGRPPEGRSPRGRTPEGRSPRGRTPEGRPPKGRPPRGRPPKGRPPKGRPPKGRPPKGRPPKGRTQGGPGRRTKRGPSRGG